MATKARTPVSTQLLAALNYVILFGYAAFLYFAMKADPGNQIYVSVCIILATANVGTALIGLIGVLVRVDAAIRGTFTLLILEHLIGFIMGSLLLVECFYEETHPTMHHSTRVAAYFLHKSRPLAVALGTAIIVASLVGCLTIANVAEWQTDIEAEVYLDDRERESLLKRENMSPTASPSAMGRVVTDLPPPVVLDMSGGGGGESPTKPPPSGISAGDQSTIDVNQTEHEPMSGGNKDSVYVETETSDLPGDPPDAVVETLSNHLPQSPDALVETLPKDLPAAPDAVVETLPKDLAEDLPEAVDTYGDSDSEPQLIIRDQKVDATADMMV